MRARWPALLLLLFAGWCGTFYGGAGAIAAAVGVATLLAVAARSSSGRDPLGLGRRWWVTWAAVGWLAGTAALSPVPRAGWQAVVLAPALLALSGSVRGIGELGGERRARLGAGLGLVGAGLAIWALADGLVRRIATGSLEPLAMPLGHHLLLGLVLVGLLPSALEAAGRRGGLFWLAPALVGAAAVGTGSVLTLAATAVVLLAWAVPPSRILALGAVVALLAAVPIALRFGAFDGDRASLAARAVYWRAGWAGALERPWAGWGPGSTPWTLALHLRPVPGVNPPGELVGDLHSLPLQVPYEIGWPALAGLLVLGGLWLRGSRSARDGLARSARLGVLGWLVVTSGGVTLETSAPWVLLAVLVGAGAAPGGGGRRRPGRGWRPVWLAYAGLALLALGPSLWARYAYDRARAAASPAGASTWLDRAVASDPSFPLYRARRAWLELGPGAAKQALRAAEETMGSADLWLAAASLEPPGARSAERLFLRACELDRLSAVPVFLAAPLAEDPDVVMGRAVRGLASQPLLAAATAWGTELPPLEAGVERLSEVAGIDAGWRDAAVTSLGALPRGGSVVWLTREVDGDPATAMSLHLFRRRSWFAEVAAVPLWKPAWERIDLPRAAELSTTSPAVFGGCG